MSVQSEGASGIPTCHGGLMKNLLKLPANPANTSSIYHGGHLLALNEGGKPWNRSRSAMTLP